MRPELERKYTYGLVQRLLHWQIALSLILLSITGYIAQETEAGGERAYLWAQHMFFGRFLLVGIAGRLVWGVVGPEHARFKALFHIRTWTTSLRDKRILSADGAFGHHPQASLSYLGLYAVILLMVSTGFLLAAIKHGVGPLTEWFLDEVQYQRPLKMAHEYGWWFVGFFMVTHIAALVFHEWRDNIPIAQGMISGFQYRTRKGKDHDDHL